MSSNVLSAIFNEKMQLNDKINLIDIKGQFNLIDIKNQFNLIDTKSQFNEIDIKSQFNEAKEKIIDTHKYTNIDEEDNETENETENEDINKLYDLELHEKKLNENEQKSIQKDDTFTMKQALLLNSLISFYKNKNNLNIIVPIISQQTNISLRLLDWLVTNYSKKYNICYTLHDKYDEDGYILSNYIFNLWMDYKNQLKAYSKKQFDPFCRRERIMLNIKTMEVIIGYNEAYLNEDMIITTVGQLNFFKWAITFNVILYAFENKAAIEADMLRSSKKIDTSNNRQLSKNNHSAKCHKIKTIIRFYN